MKSVAISVAFSFVVALGEFCSPASKTYSNVIEILRCNPAHFRATPVMAVELFHCFIIEARRRTAPGIAILQPDQSRTGCVRLEFVDVSGTAAHSITETQRLSARMNRTIPAHILSETSHFNLY